MTIWILVAFVSGLVIGGIGALVLEGYVYDETWFDGF